VWHRAMPAGTADPGAELTDGARDERWPDRAPWQFAEQAVSFSSYQTTVLGGFALLLVVVAILLGVALMRQLAYRRSATSACRGFAALVHGAHEGAWSVSFSHRGIPTHLNVRAPVTVRPRQRFRDPADVLLRGGHGVVRLTFDLLSPLPRLLAYSCGPLERLEYALAFGGLPAAQTGNPLFDRQFNVTAEDPGQALRLLTYDVQRQLAELGPAISLDTAGPRLTIAQQIPRAPSALGLKAFYDCAGQLLDLLAQTCRQP